MSKTILFKIGISGLALSGIVFAFMFSTSHRSSNGNVVLASSNMSTPTTSSQAPTSPINSKTVGIDMQFASNLADDRVLLGASHNVFVGKVVGRVNTRIVPLDSRFNIPITQFSVEVISNIKGNLQETVTVNQVGGYEGNSLFVVQGGDTFAPSSSINSSNYLLQPGDTYLFATRYNNGTYDLWPYAGALTLISGTNTLSVDQLKAVASQNNRFIALQAAYPHEILWSYDVKDHDTRNSYQSVQAALAPRAATFVATSTASTTATSSGTQSVGY